MQKYKMGLVIGRFQPFHKGHAYLIRQALQRAETLIIGIGSTNKRNADNPFSFIERKQMVTLFLQKEKSEERVRSIIALPDIPSDDLWFDETMRQTGAIDVVFGNNAWVNDIFSARNIPVVIVGHYRRHILEGKKIRALMRDQTLWEDRVPEYIVPIASKEI